MLPENVKVLIADDMPTILTMLKTSLKGMGIKNVVSAEDGSVAWQKILESQQSEAPIDLIICDWNMPEMTGLDVLRKVRGNENTKNVPFIALTSENDRTLITEAVVSGVSQYILKPFTSQIIEERIASAWKKHH